MKKDYLKPEYWTIESKGTFCINPTSNPPINTNPDGPVVGGGGDDSIEELVKAQRNNEWDEEW